MPERDGGGRPSYDELVTGPGPEMTPEIREKADELAKQPRKSLPAEPLPITKESGELLDLARDLLTPSKFTTTDEWIEQRIRWHRLDGNLALADEMLKDENGVRRALGKPVLERPE